MSLGSSPGTILIGSHLILNRSIRSLMPPRRETGEEDNECCEEKEDHCSQDRPHADGIIRMTSTAILVDMVLDDTEEHEIGDHNRECDDPGDRSDHRSKKSTADAGAESEEEGDECKTAGNWVEDHDAGEAFGGVSGGSVEVRVIDQGHDVGGVVADVFAGAVILIGAGGRNIEYTVTKGSERNTRMADIALVGKHDLQDRDIIDDWRRDCSDQQQDSSDEEEKGADMVEDSCFGHCDGVCFEAC